MGKLVILVALCVGALLGDNTITIGEFSIKSTPQKDAMKIEIFKNKKPFQEIIENWESVCDINFLFTGIHSKEEPLAFGAICDGVYSAAEYEFDLKTNKFVYAGAVEEISIQELAQTKEHYIGLAYDSEEGGAEKMHNQMQNIFLEQIERFNGILIATTNLLDNIDSAFSRRFDYKIKFEKPTEKERLEIWQKTLPKNAPIAKDLNLAAIAKYPLTGAQIALAIKNAVMNVAIQNAPLFTNAVFERAIKKELSGAFGEEKTLGFLS